MRIIVLLTALLGLFNSGIGFSKEPNNDQPLKVSILGDSYSTFEGWVKPDTNELWYQKPEHFKFANRNDVRTVEQTWWHQLIGKMGWQLERNNSYSGATIAYLGYYNADFSDRSFITRCNNLGNPDLILIFGATNDSWIKTKMGKDQFSDWTKKDLFSFRPAMACFLKTIKEAYPNAEMCFILNTALTDSINKAVDDMCQHYDVPCLHLKNIDKQAGHPSIKGMASIAAQVEEWYRTRKQKK